MTEHICLFHLHFYILDPQTVERAFVEHLGMNVVTRYGLVESEQVRFTPEDGWEGIQELGAMRRARQHLVADISSSMIELFMYMLIPHTRSFLNSPMRISKFFSRPLAPDSVTTTARIPGFLCIQPRLKNRVVMAAPSTPAT